MSLKPENVLVFQFCSLKGHVLLQSEIADTHFFQWIIQVLLKMQFRFHYSSAQAFQCFPSPSIDNPMSFIQNIRSIVSQFLWPCPTLLCPFLNGPQINSVQVLLGFSFVHLVWNTLLPNIPMDTRKGHLKTWMT